jgi:hypothetical protein
MLAAVVFTGSSVFNIEAVLGISTLYLNSSGLGKGSKAALVTATSSFFFSSVLAIISALFSIAVVGVISCYPGITIVFCVDCVDWGACVGSCILLKPAKLPVYT